MKQAKRIATLAAFALGGAADASVGIVASYRGSVDETATHFSFLAYGVGTDGQFIVRNWFVFDLSSIMLPISSAELHLFNPEDGYISPDPTEDYVLYDVTTDISLLINGFGGVAAYEDLGSGTTYGSYIASPADNGATVMIPLNPAAIAELNMTGGLWAIGGAFENFDNDPFNIEVLFGSSAEVPFTQTQLVVTLIPAPGAAALLVAAFVSLAPRRRRA